MVWNKFDTWFDEEQDRVRQSMCQVCGTKNEYLPDWHDQMKKIEAIIKEQIS